MSQPCVLLLADGRPDPASVREAFGRLHASGARVLLAAMGPLAEGAGGGLPSDDVHDLAAAAESRGPAFRRALRAAEPDRRLWLHLEQDDWVAERILDVDLVVPLRPRARDAARELAEKHPHLRAVPGVTRGVKALEEGKAGQPDTTGPRASKDRAPGRFAPVAGKLALKAPGLPDARRAELARDRAMDLLEAGRYDEAEDVVRSAARKIGDPRLRADLLGDVVSWLLAHGQQPTLAVEAVSAELEVADDHLAHQRYADAAETFDEAARTAFHRTLHFDGLRSPLADDPTGFTAPFRDSAVAAAVRAPRGHRGPDPTQVDRPGRRTRLLITTRKNDDFLGEIRQHFEEHTDFDTRYVDFLGVDALDRFAREPGGLVEQVLGGDTTLVAEAQKAFDPHLEWADVVFAEWCTALAALLSRVDHPTTRVVVRMHSYEAFTSWPHLADFSGIDDMMFVSEHLRDLAVAAVPGLTGPHAPRLHVIANAMDLRRMVRPKPDHARFTLGVVGASKVVKDPRWAIEVLRHLRKHDERYRLLLIRGDLEEPAAAARDYARRLERDLEELEPLGAVSRTAHTDDVPGALEQVGVVLSSSVRESFHVGLVEGAASGAVPVVRNWPFFPGSARKLFPSEWVVETPEEAAQRILDATVTEEKWRASGAAVAREVLDRWDWGRVSAEFEAVLSI
jgi:glycosyltransferase involved in cell wall biosynthesis